MLLCDLHESQLCGVGYFISGRMNSLNFILAITGSDRPAGCALSLSASCTYVCETEGEDIKYGFCLIMFSVHCSQSELLSHPSDLLLESSTACLS